MRIFTRPRLILSVVAVLGALTWALSPGLARSPSPSPSPSGVVQIGGEAGGGGQPQRIYIASPMNAEMAKTWLKLEQRVPMHFPNDTPLADVLVYVKTATSDGKDKKAGIQFYVDPMSLQEAERTNASPVTIDLEDLPLSTTLELLLKQLNLGFHVQKDGLVVIGTIEGEGSPKDPSMAVLSALRNELRELRSALHHGAKDDAAGGSKPATSMSGPAGGAGGGFR
jgi:hypothetical protein